MISRRLTTSVLFVLSGINIQECVSANCPKPSEISDSRNQQPLFCVAFILNWSSFSGLRVHESKVVCRAT